MRYLAVTCLLFAAPAAAHDFAVHTVISAAADDTSNRTLVTIFAGEQIFEYAMDEPGIVTVFDLQDECIWRLDAATRTRSSLPFRMLARLVEEATLRSVRLSPTVRFAAEPHYTDRHWDPGTQRLQLAHELISYEAELERDVDPDQALRYRIYADWSARLNTIAPGLPPGARLELNREIAMRDSVPVQVVCQRQTPEGAIIELKSQHQFLGSLTDSQSQQAEQFRQWLRDFKKQPWQR